MDINHKTYLTASGLKKLEEEYKELKEKKIPSIAQKIDEAKQQGDLSENAEYHTAREEMAWAQTRLIELEQLLQNVEVISTSRGKTGNKRVVKLGSTIRVKQGGREMTYTIVGAQEAEPARGLISNESPIGDSFLGSEEGDTVEVDVPSGKKQYTILSIE